MRRKPKDLTDYKPLVLAIDPTAKLISWNGEAPKGYWVTGEKFGGWETKVTYSEVIVILVLVFLLALRKLSEGE